MARVPFPADEFPRDWWGEITVESVFKGPLAQKLVAIARRRNQHPNDMLASLVEAAIEGDLVSAVIDDGPDKSAA